MKIKFKFGDTIQFVDMPQNSIALDGACQAPQLDPAQRRYSFDHHAGCLRFATLATCQQVALAIQMGVVTDEETLVFINDLDADTVLAVWLLQNPDRLNEPQVKELVERVGLTDAHGPLFMRHWLHSQLSPRYGSNEPQTLEMLEEFLGKVTAFADGKMSEPVAAANEITQGFGWSPKTGWIEVVSNAGFMSVYAQGFLAGVLFTAAAEDTWMYTVGKRSDFVPFPVGPSHVNRQSDSSSYRSDTLLGALGIAELEVNPQQSYKDNWGGASTVGGSPRVTVDREGMQVQVASRLTPDRVLEICKRFG